MAGTIGTSIFVTYLVPPTLLFIPLANIIRTFQLGDTPWALILTYQPGGLSCIDKVSIAIKAAASRFC